MSLTKTVFLFLLLILSISPAFSQSDSFKEQDRILKYGLDTDVSLLIKKLLIQENDEHNETLMELYTRTQNYSLKDEILLFFTERKYESFKEIAIEELSKEFLPNSSALSLIHYVTSMNLTESSDVLTVLMNGDNRPLIIASVRGLGRLGLYENGQAILEKMTTEDFSADYLGDFIWSLGELRYSPSSPILLEKYEEASDQPIIRALIIEALGKMKEESSLNIIVEGINDSNIRIKNASVKAIIEFGAESARDTLISASRDNQSSTRMIAIEGLGKLKIVEGIPMLLYRAETDPDQSVRATALDSINAIDITQYTEVIKKILIQKNLDPRTYGHIMKKDLKDSIIEITDSLLQRLDNEIENQFSPFALIAAELLANNKSDLFIEFSKIIAKSRNPKVVSLLFRGVGINYPENETNIYELWKNNSKTSREVLQGIDSNLKRLTSPK